MDGQINITEYLKDQHPEMKWGGCGQCVCKSCLYHWSERCPYGKCFDDKRAIENPYDKAHPDKPPRTLWSDWSKPGEQAHWCRGGTFYPVYTCKNFVKYKGLEIRKCLECNIAVYQDGYMSCSLVDTVGCEECYRRLERKLEKEDARYI